MIFAVRAVHLTRKQLMRWILTLWLTLVFVGCSNTRIDEQAKISLISPDTILFDGSITQQNVAVFEELLNAQFQQVATIVIKSVGGDVLSGIYLGELVHSHQLNVIIRGVCASSCANYVATASSNVIVEEGAILGWHGGSLQSLYGGFEHDWFDSLFADKESFKEYLAEWQLKERAFFEKVGVNQALTVLGMVPGLKEKRNTMLYSFDKQTLNLLGTSIKYVGEQNRFDVEGNEVLQVFQLSPQQLQVMLKNHSLRLAQARVYGTN